MATTNNPIKKVYIAGPMTGYKDFNYPAFNNAARILSGWRYEVENPAENDLPINSEWSDYMRKAIAQLVTCDMVVLLDGWEQSRGARLEVHIAEDLKIKIITLNNMVHQFNNPPRFDFKKFNGIDL